MTNILKLALLLTMLVPQNQISSQESASMAYVKHLGSGWNLGNTFDSHDVQRDLGEQTWDNPIVTQALIQAIKAEGFQSIRIPLTIDYRMDSDYVIDEAYLSRYEEVVGWALEEDLYVLINVHHDSTQWLYQWDGQETSEEYQRFTAIWSQLADRFSDYNHQLFFESINEPYFDAEEGEQYSRLAKINQAFHTVVRESGGLNAERMLVLPTLLSKGRQSDLDALLSEIQQLNDPNLIASIHYYGEWEFSNNIGITMLDEVFREGKNQRQLNQDMIERLEKTFTNQQIGVLIGEYGLLGFDRHPDANNIGETYKFIEQLNRLTRDKSIALMLWDNGQHFDRTEFTWKPKQFGDIVIQSIYGNSAYGVYIDQSFMQQVEDELFVNIEFNGTHVEQVLFNGSELRLGRDYEVNADGIYLYPDVIAGKLDTVPLSSELGTLTIQFNQGATWNQHLSLINQMRLKPIEVEQSNQSISIPVEFAGNKVKRLSIQSNEEGLISTIENWPYLIYLEDYIPDYRNGELTITKNVVDLMLNGHYEMTIETFTSDTYVYELVIQSRQVSGNAFEN